MLPNQGAESVVAARMACQPLGGGAIPTSALQPAHQYRIRLTRAETDARDNLFGAWWRDVDTDIGKATVKEIDRTTAAAIIEQYEYLGTMPAVSWHYYGIYFDDALGGVVVYGPDYTENLGAWDAYGFTGKIILLQRGACIHWAHPHSASKLIRTSMRMLPERFEVITACVDRNAGEIGTIYQACGFHYVGQLTAGTRTVGVAGGRRYPERSLHALFHTQAKDALGALGITQGTEQRKERYFAFRGTKGTQRKHRDAIQGRIKPYPKRLA